LHDDMRTYVPNVYNNIEGNITIANLLTHTSGIRDVYDLWALKGQTWWKLFIDNGDAIKLLQNQTDLNFKPGTEYIYSNSNYILLTEIIKKAAGKKFNEFANDLFAELQMANTSFATNYMAIIPNKARPYANWGSWREYPAVTETHGDGALFTTLNDQLHWEKNIQLGTHKVLSKKGMTQSQSTIATIGFKKYGYGLMFGTYKGLDYSYHDGNTGAYNATFLRFPTKKTAIVLMSNNGNVPTNYLAKQLADIVLNLSTDKPVYPEIPKKTERVKHLQDLVGSYKHEDGTIIKITTNDGFLFREIYQREPVKLIPVKHGLFYYETKKDLKMNFTHMNTKAQKLTIYLSSQPPSSYHKLPYQEVSTNTKMSINGHYLNSETDTEIIVKYIDNDVFSIIKNGRERKAKLLLNDYLRMNSYEIVVIRDEKGNTIGLNIKNGRIKNVLFHKK